jgi:hypothetical protein
LFISDENWSWGSINSVIQFEQSRDEEDDVIIMGISLRHDEQTPPVELLLILLVSFIFCWIFRSLCIEASRANRP